MEAESGVRWDKCGRERERGGDHGEEELYGSEPDPRRDVVATIALTLSID